MQPGFEGHVYLLRKAIYGLKQSSQQRHKHLDTFLKSLGFQPTWADPAIYIFYENDNIVLRLEYVDELIITSNDLEKMEYFFTKMKSEFAARTIDKLEKK